MAVQPGSTEKRYAANGVSLTYTVPFLVIEAGDLQVFLNGVLLTSGYTHTGIGNPSSSLTFSIPPLGDLYLQLSVPFQRLVDYQLNGDFLSTTVNRDVDRIWQALKQLLRITSRSPVLGVNDIDGSGWYQAKGNGIRNLRDPVEPQDAATRHWSTQYISEILATGQGPVNNAANVIYSYPDTSIKTVQSLSSATGSSGIGHGPGTVGDALVLTESRYIASTKRASGYQIVTPSSNAITLNVNDASTVGVSVTQQINTVTIAGAVAGERYSLDLIFRQDAVGHSVTLPASIIKPTGVTSLVSTIPYSVSLVSLLSTDGGVTWLSRNAVISDNSPVPAFPAISDMNATFNSEGDSTAAFTATNSSMSITSSYLRCTKVTGGSLSKISALVTFTPSNSDYILYGKVRARNDANSIATIWFLNGSKEVSIWFGSASANAAATPGAISICGTTGASTRNVASAGTGYAYDTAPFEFALQFDNKFLSLTCWVKQGDGTWRMAARVACDWFSATTIEVLNATAGTAGAWVEFDYLTLCRPNIVALGDSVTEGKTLFSPNLSLGLIDSQSTIWAHAPIPAYLGQRNNLIVNKGVGGQNSSQVAARAAVDCAGSRLVIIPASSNDYVAGFSQATRTTNIQNTVNAVAGLGAASILLNGSYGTKLGADNSPSGGHRDYMKDSWDTYLPTVTGVAARVNIMTPLLDADGFLAASMANDSIHFNSAGYTAAGGLLARST